MPRARSGWSLTAAAGAAAHSRAPLWDGSEVCENARGAGRENPLTASHAGLLSEPAQDGCGIERSTDVTRSRGRHAIASSSSGRVERYRGAVVA